MLLLSFFFKPGRSRSVARYEDAHQRPEVSRALPYLAPAPLAAAVTPYGGWRVEPFFPIQYGDAVRRALSTSKESDNPHAESPRPHRRSLIQLLKNRESFRGGWVLSSNTLTSGVHSTPCVFFNQPSFPSSPPFFPPSLLLSVGCVNPLSNGSSTGSRGCVVRAAQPSAFGKLAFFTHAFREGRVGAGGCGGSCWRGCGGGEAYYSQLCGGGTLGP